MISNGNGMVLLGYFGVHARNTSSPTYCDAILDTSGIMLVEAMRYAINKINQMQNGSFLFGNQLRYRIVDTCRNTATLRRSFFSSVGSYYLGIIGPPTSDEAAIAATVHSAYKAAVVSHSASSIVLEDRDTYLNFFRTIPSDRLQVEALVGIASHFNWSYLSVVASYGSYGQSGLTILAKMLKESNKCIAKQVNLPDAPTSDMFHEAIDELTSDEKARVVIMFTSTHDTKGLLMAAKKAKLLTWLSSTSWHTEMNIREDMEGAANGSLILQYADLYDEEFTRYFSNMTLASNNYTWFREFWSQTFNCSTGLRKDNKTVCTGNEDLKTKYSFSKYSLVKPVLNAVESIACAFRKSIFELCPRKTKSCIEAYHSRTYEFEERIVKHLRTGDSSCTELSNAVNLNEKGYYPRDLLVLNYDGSVYKEVGIWRYNQTEKKGTLKISADKISWKDGQNPISLCSLPCKRGERKVQNINNDICCFVCQKCGINQVLVNNSCIDCGVYERASAVDQKCKPLPTVFIEVSDPLGCTIVFGSSLGALLNTGFFGIFIRFRDSRIVKASSRELSFIIILFLYVCFISPVAFLIRPSNITCGLQRFIVGLSLTGCYTPLMLKTNRIYRIFTASKTMVTKPILVGSKSQILICLGLIGIQLLLGIMWLVADPPKVIKQHIKRGTEVAVTCKFDAFNVLLNLIPCFVLTAICTVYAFKTRKFPSNFNEAYSIGVTMYICCFLWGIFIPLLLFLELDKDNIFTTNYVISGFTITVAFITLIGLFGPKLRKLLSQQNINPSAEMFSDFQNSNATLAIIPTKLATIPEDDISLKERRESLPRFRTSVQGYMTADASTNT